MELDLPLLRRRLVDRLPFTMDTPSPVPAMCAFILFSWECEEIVARLEWGEQVEYWARNLVELHAIRDPDDPDVHLAIRHLGGALAANPNGKPQDDDTPKDQPDPRQPGPNAYQDLVAAVDEALNLLDRDEPLAAGMVLIRARR